MTARATEAGLSARTVRAIVDEAFRRGWPFKVHPNGTVEVSPPAQSAPRDPFELLDMSK